jgi:hypothetical protein
VGLIRATLNTRRATGQPELKEFHHAHTTIVSEAHSSIAIAQLVTVLRTRTYLLRDRFRCRVIERFAKIGFKRGKNRPFPQPP